MSFSQWVWRELQPGNLQETRRTDWQQMTVMSFPTELRSLLWRQRGLITWHRLTTAIKQLRTAHTLTRLSTLINITTGHFRDEFLSGRPQSNLHTHWHTQPFYCPFPGLPGWASARRNLLDFMEQGKITEADTPTIRLGSTPSGFRTNQWPTSIIPLFLCWIPFLPQHSHFIMAWDGHQICWLAYPVPNKQRLSI